jgi:hypothetical protein
MPDLHQLPHHAAVSGGVLAAGKETSPEGQPSPMGLGRRAKKKERNKLKACHKEPPSPMGLERRRNKKNVER